MKNHTQTIQDLLIKAQEVISRGKKNVLEAYEISLNKDIILNRMKFETERTKVLIDKLNEIYGIHPKVSN